MNLEQLHHIVETAKFKSLSKASSALHITQSGLSQSISAIEKELGLTLFTRSRLGAHPTSEGRVIIKKAVQIIFLVQELHAEADRHAQLSKGKISLSGIPGVMGSFIKTVAFLKREYPYVSIEIAEKGSFQLIKDVQEGIIDAAFVAMNEELLNTNITLDFRPVLQGKMVVCVGRNSLLASRTTIAAEELKAQKLVLYDDDYVHWFLQEFRSKHGEVDVLFTTNNANAISLALMEGLAVTIGHDYSFLDQPLVQSGDIVPLELENFSQQSVEFGWLLGGKKQSHLLKEFIDYFEGDLFINRTLGQ